MAAQSQLYKMIPIAVAEAIETGEYLIEWGQSEFSGTGTTVEVRTNMTLIDTVLATPLDPTLTGTAGYDQIYSDGAITTSAVTFTRGGSGTSGLKFWYVFIGRSWASS